LDVTPAEHGLGSLPLDLKTLQPDAGQDAGRLVTLGLTSHAVFISGLPKLPCTAFFASPETPVWGYNLIGKERVTFSWDLAFDLFYNQSGCQRWLPMFSVVWLM
jgi:hypothetical protein